MGTLALLRTQRMRWLALTQSVCFPPRKGALVECGSGPPLSATKAMRYGRASASIAAVTFPATQQTLPNVSLRAKLKEERTDAEVQSGQRATVRLVGILGDVFAVRVDDGARRLDRMRAHDAVGGALRGAVHVLVCAQPKHRDSQCWRFGMGSIEAESRRRKVDAQARYM